MNTPLLLRIYHTTGLGRNGRQTKSVLLRVTSAGLIFSFSIVWAIYCVVKSDQGFSGLIPVVLWHKKHFYHKKRHRFQKPVPYNPAGKSYAINIEAEKRCF